MVITIPSGLWIRGQRMDVELAGDLRLIHKEAYPTVSGELQAIGGHFQLTLDVAGSRKLSQVITHTKYGVGHSAWKLLLHTLYGLVKAVFDNRQIRWRRRLCHNCSQCPQKSAKSVIERLIL